MSKSIVTLQLGNYSNFIGSHYWNLHEFSFQNPGNNSVNNDVTYYEGLTVNNTVTYTPKVISWDWKENLGPRIIDDIYEEIENHGIDNAQSRREINSLKVNSYRGKVEVNTGFTAAELNANKTTAIPDTKAYNEWNEYLFARLHPNSLTKLPKLYRDLDSGNFRNFSQGMDLTKNREYYNRMEDQTRYFVEKCDVLQGFQILCDSNDGFSGVGINFLTQLSDEYSKDIISFPTSTTTDNTDINSVFNRIFLYNEMNSKSIFWSPISAANHSGSPNKIPNIDYDERCKYETGGILALALKSLLMPCFANSNVYTLSDYGSVIGRHSNNKLASLATAMPFPIGYDDTMETTITDRLHHPNDCYSVVNPYVESMGKIDSLIGNIFGVDERRAMNAVRRANGLYDRCSSVAEMMETFVGAGCGTRNAQFVSEARRIDLGAPFPRMFSGLVDRFCGELLSGAGESGDCRHCPQAIPASTVLFTEDNADYLLPMYDVALEALQSRRLSTMMIELEADYLGEAVENFRSMI